MRKHFKVVYCSIIVLVLIVSIIFAFSFAEKLIDKSKYNDETLSYTETGNNRVLYNGEYYDRNNYIDSVLLIGSDSYAQADKAYTQADFIALLVIDNMDARYRILHINRDTMTAITQLDTIDRKIGTFSGQLALAHSYGSNGQIQCLNTVEAVENLLYGINIDHYVSITMDVVPMLNDSIGGVTVTLENDFPVLGEEFVRGATVTLKGEQALSFVRFRNDDAVNSNLERMERQRLYISALWEKYDDENAGITVQSLLDIGEHMVSDCSLNTLSYLLGQLKDYEYDGIVTLKGEASKNGQYVEYHIDEDAAQASVIDLFYKKAKK